MPKESAETLGKNTTNISQLLIDTASLDERLTEVEEETSSIENSLAPVATSGSYNDLTDKPDIPPNHNRGTFTTLASVPLPNNASRNPPIVNGDYVIVGTS
jgi:hypothetical protein